MYTSNKHLAFLNIISQKFILCIHHVIILLCFLSCSLLEADGVFVHFSSMLGLVASKLNVVVSPLRATILQVHLCVHRHIHVHVVVYMYNYSLGVFFFKKRKISGRKTILYCQNMQMYVYMS